MPPQPRMQFAFTAQYTGKSVCQLVQQFRVNYIRSLHWLHWSKYLVTIAILLTLYDQSGLNPQTTGIFFNKMWFKIFHYNCNISVWNWTNTIIIYSTLWIMMASSKSFHLNECLLNTLIIFSIESYLFHWHCSNHYKYLPSGNEATLTNIGKWIKSFGNHDVTISKQTPVHVQSSNKCCFDNAIMLPNRERWQTK